jgi:erythromycin esterase-like protein
MRLSNQSTYMDLIREAARPISGNNSSFDPLIHLAADAQFVLLGEASHGTHEFYSARSEITKRLIREKGFQAVAVEADWPDADRVNRFVRGRSQDRSAARALTGFTRFPVWMWRNRDVEEFVRFLRDYNDKRDPNSVPVGFYGLDLYSLNRSRYEVIRYLDGVDPQAAAAARARYACFDHFGENEQVYGQAVAYRLAASCEDEVIGQLVDIQERSWAYLHRDGQVAEDDFFSAEQNARLVKNAEEYYRAMFHGRTNTWNLRDAHMAQTLEALAAHLEKRFGKSKVVVWAHNSHLGNARATDRAAFGEWNVGQLVRERFGRSVLVGFTTYSGTVTAASEWGGPHETKRVLPALPESYEALFHAAGIPKFLLIFSGDKSLSSRFQTERLERAIGVIYMPETERASHYFHARLSDQFDAILHFDETRAVDPLPHAEEEQSAETPDTYPIGV